MLSIPALLPVQGNDPESPGDTKHNNNNASADLNGTESQSLSTAT